MLDKLEVGSVDTEEVGLNGHHSGLDARISDRCGKDGLPCIVLSGDLPMRAISDWVVKRLQERNRREPFLFQRSGKLIQLRRVDIPEQDTYKMVLAEVTLDVLKGLIDRTVNFVAVRNSNAVHVEPPQSVVKDILARGNWPFPGIVGVTEVPVLRPDGTVLDVPGYDPATRLMYVPAPDFDMPAIPEYPTQEDARRAVDVLMEAIGSFPFADFDSLDSMLAGILTPIVRPAIAGPVPMLLIDATSKGTGKSKLAGIAGYIASGHKAAVIPPPESEAEMRKTITTAVMDASSVNILDNLHSRLASPSLDALLTALVWRSRVLGKNEDFEGPNRGCWYATGNNITIGGDLQRRTYWVRLDAGMAKPWKRKGPVWLEETEFGSDEYQKVEHGEFKNLDIWLPENRGRLVAACLTIARAWFVAGRPKAEQAQVFGSYEAWNEIIGGMLWYAGERDFLSSLDQQQDEHDWDGQQWAAFLQALYDGYRSGEFTAAEIALRKTVVDSLLRAEEFKKASEDKVIEALPDSFTNARSSNDLKKQLGGALNKRVGTIYDETTRLAIHKRYDSHSKVNYWSIAPKPLPKPLKRR